MKRFLSICLVLLAASVAAPRANAASEGFDDLVKLIKSGINEEVILAYVEASPTAYDLSVDEILYLNDLGVSPKVLAATVNRGKELRGQKAASSPAPELDTAPPEVVREEEKDHRDAPVVGRPVTPAKEDLERIALRHADEEEAVPIRRRVDDDVEREPAETEREVVRERVVHEVVERQVVAPAPEQANVSYFYETLQPYGTWVTVEDQWVWQPTVAVVDRSWQPYYHRGRWVYTDCGWTWHSDYSWGWAPFHYGRWSHHSHYGWVWTPDTVWAPAWVSWRSCDTHYAWAPLPPAARYESGVGFTYRGKNVAVDFSFGLVERDYCYVPVNRFCDSSLPNYGVAHGHRGNVYNNTTIIQNNYTYVDNRIINNGPPVERVRRQTNRDIHPTHIVDAKVQAGQPVDGTGMRRDAYVAYRPTLANAAPETPPAVIARREAAARRQQAEAEQRAQAKTRRDLRQDTMEAAAAERRAKAAAETAAQRERAAAQTAERKEDRQEAAATRAAKTEQAKTIQNQKEAERDAAAEARRVQNAQEEAERRAKAQQAEQQRKDQATARKQQAAEEQAQEALRREQARQAAQQRENEMAARRQAEAAAEKAQRDQARADAQARQDALELQRKQEAEARRQATLQRQIQNNGVDTNADGVNDARAADVRRQEAQARAQAAEQQRRAEAEARRAQEAQAAQQRQLEAQQRQAAQQQRQIQNNGVDTNGDGVNDITKAEQRRQQQQAAAAQRQAEAEARREQRKNK